MARDAIRILRTVRRRTVEEARHALAACLLAESEAAGIIRAIDDQEQADRVAHHTLTEVFRFGDMFVRRAGTRETERRAAADALTAAQERTAAARATLVAARTAAEAVETLIAERAAAAQVEASRREQHDLDDMARTRFDSGERGAAGGPK